MIVAASVTGATLGLAGVTGLLALIALVQLISFNRSEARRTQPVAIVHRHGSDNPMRIPIHITNEGAGTAYNTRVGVRIGGVEHPLGDDDGFRYVVRAGGREPPRGSHAHNLDVPYWSFSVARRAGDTPRVIFYARYDNAFGKTWETINPRDPLDSFTVRRARPWVRWRRLHAWRQQRKRERWKRIVDGINEERGSAQTGKPLSLRRRILRDLWR
jgi:hypothetical protein